MENKKYKNEKNAFFNVDACFSSTKICHDLMKQKSVFTSCFPYR